MISIGGIVSKNKTIAVSGGFDPIHKGHVRMILAAAQYGDVIVILNSDDWLHRKKGYKFMTWDDRAEIIRAIRGVVNVVNTIDDKDETVCNTLRNLKRDVDLDYFANGGDRYNTNSPLSVALVNADEEDIVAFTRVLGVALPQTTIGIFC